jgi:hypothetical protein
MYILVFLTLMTNRKGTWWDCLHLIYIKWWAFAVRRKVCEFQRRHELFRGNRNSEKLSSIHEIGWVQTIDIKNYIVDDPSCQFLWDFLKLEVNQTFEVNRVWEATELMLLVVTIDKNYHAQVDLWSFCIFFCSPTFFFQPIRTPGVDVRISIFSPFSAKKMAFFLEIL